MLGLEPAADRQASSGIKELPTHVQGRGAPAATGGRVTGHTGIGSCGVLALNGRPALRRSGRPAGHVERERHGWDGAERADPRSRHWKLSLCVSMVSPVLSAVPGTGQPSQGWRLGVGVAVRRAAQSVLSDLVQPGTRFADSGEHTSSPAQIA